MMSNMVGQLIMCYVYTISCKGHGVAVITCPQADHRPISYAAAADSHYNRNTIV